jgi:hypothetical protein
MTRTTRTPGSTPQPVAAVVVTPEPANDLPNAVDIDPHAIRGPVQTKQGWVVPAPQAQARG